MRYLIAVCLTVLPVAGTAANPDCKVLGDIVEAVATERGKGAGVNDAMVAVAASYTGEQERFAAGIPPLAEWVYGLPGNLKPSDIGEAYQAACEAQ